MSVIFGGIDHIGIAVHDLEASTTTYRDILGLTDIGGETLESRGLEVRFFDTGGQRVELLGATREDSEISAFLQKRGEGIHHMCIKVSDIEAAVAQITARGGRVVGEGIQRGAHGRRVVFIHPKSASGVLLELVEITNE